MKTHEIKFVIHGIQLPGKEDDDFIDFAEALYGISNDAFLAQQDGKVLIYFDRDAATQEEAIASARADVLAAFAALVQVDLSALE